MNPKIAAHVEVLRSPTSGSPLELREGILVAIGSEEKYGFVGPSAILVAEVRPEHQEPPPPEIVSRNVAAFEPPPQYAGEAFRVLHLGCGAVESTASNTLSLDVLPLPNVDVVAEIERLPFADACMDYVASSAVFEHVRDPVRAIDEVKRVLKPGGTLYIDTAFMQSYHGFPGHYFNLSPLAVEAYIGGAFEILASGVAPDSSELVAIQSLVGRFASYLSPSARVAFEARTIGELLGELAENHGPSNPLVADASEYSRRAMGASFYVVARKPTDYDVSVERSPQIFGYYEARMAVLQRQHEIDLYRRFSSSLGADVSTLPTEQRRGEAILSDIAPAGGTAAAFTEAAAALSTAEQQLIAYRDPYIGAYLRALERVPPSAPHRSAADRPVLLETERIRLRKGRYGYMLTPRLDDTIGFTVDLYGEWAEAECALLRPYLRPGDVVIDAGANIGTHMLFFSQAVGPTGRVLAFEPQPETFAIMAANAALNDRTNVVPHRAGLGSMCGTLAPRRSDAAPMNWGAVRLEPAAAGDDRATLVPVVTIDSLGLERCDLLKIDVEGMEIDVLAGAAETIARHRPLIYAENTDAARSLAVCSWLMDHGYRVFWHAAPAYNPDNVGREATNIFGDATELNIFCMPGETGAALPDLPESSAPTDFALERTAVS